MPRYRDRLPQLDGGIFLTDGGLETCLIFHEGVDLPHFASFNLLDDAEGLEALRIYYNRYLSLAARHGTGFILETPTWRASADWAAKLGYSTERLAAMNAESVDLMRELRDGYRTTDMPIVISGCVGPRGDGYDPGSPVTADDAEAYHRAQVEIFASTDADMIAALTMTNTPEAIGATRAAQSAGMPVAVSFTVETDGRLPTGQRLAEAIGEVDEATANGPAYYMINCAHPSHFDHLFAKDEAWTNRIGGIRANASTLSHAELDAAEVLDEGDPEDFGHRYRDLRARLPRLSVLGGCCGTDHRHVEQICETCVAA